MHVYLWEGSGLHGMVKKMSEVKFTLHTHIFKTSLVGAVLPGKEHLVELGFGLLFWATGSSRRLSLEWRSLSWAFCHFNIILQYQRCKHALLNRPAGTKGSGPGQITNGT